MPKKKRSNARQRAIKALDKEFSLFIRYRNLDEQGNAECYTCGKRDHPRSLQCGHFASRRYLSTRWHEDNCRVQCVGCNIYRQGEQYRFGRKLDAEDKGLADRILEQSQQKASYTITELERLTWQYKQRNERLINGEAFDDGGQRNRGGRATARRAAKRPVKRKVQKRQKKG